jgi:hypothetical protein
VGACAAIVGEELFPQVARQPAFLQLCGGVGWSEVRRTLSNCRATARTHALQFGVPAHPQCALRAPRARARACATGVDGVIVRPCTFPRAWHCSLAAAAARRFVSPVRPQHLVEERLAPALARTTTDANRGGRLLALR